jgi:hypothetical protein
MVPADRGTEETKNALAATPQATLIQQASCEADAKSEGRQG